MKNIFILLTLCIGISGLLSAQDSMGIYHMSSCQNATNSITPGTGNIPGLSPSDSLLPCSVQGLMTYDTIYFTNFTTVNYSGFNLTVNSLTIDSLYLPAGLCWSTNNANNTFSGGQNGVLYVTGIPTDSVGQYKLRIIVSVNLAGIGNVSNLNAESAGLTYRIRLKCPSASCSTINNSSADSARVFIPYAACQSCPVITVSPVQVFGTTSAYANPSGGVPPYTYSWNTSPVSQTTDTATGLTVGTNYCVTVTDHNGCTGSGCVMISNSGCPAITVTAHQIGSLTEAGTTVQGGVPPYSYSWSTHPVQSTDTATGLTVDSTYCVTVTDHNGCTGVGCVTIAPPGCPSISISVTQVGSTNSATAVASGGASPYSYTWNTTPAQHTATATGLSVGVLYTIMVTDHNGCTGTQTYSLPSCSISATATQIGSSGSAFATATSGTAPFSYSWNTSPQQNTDTATGLTNGNYTVTVTDHNGCTATATVTVSLCASITVNVAQIGVTNSATATATNGTAPYAYHWNTTPPLSTATATGLAVGQLYTITVSDHNGCPGSTTYSLTSCTITATATQIGHTGSAFATANGTPPYSYHWSNGDLTDTATALTTGLYSVTVTDTNGCKAIDTVSISTGILSVGDITGFSIYPNPSVGVFTVSVRLAAPSEIVTTVSDLTGQKIYEGHDNGTKDLNKIINLGNIPTGVYFVNITTALGTANERIVIK